jgi:hypothetical protein
MLDLSRYFPFHPIEVKGGLSTGNSMRRHLANNPHRKPGTPLLSRKPPSVNRRTPSPDAFACISPVRPVLNASSLAR